MPILIFSNVLTIVWSISLLFSSLSLNVCLSMCMGTRGSGSVLSAATSGLPQLPLPFFFDQPLWARRVSALGLDGSPVLSCSSKDDNIEERNQSNLVVSLQSLVAVGSNQDEIEVEEVTRRRDLAEAEVNFTTALTAALAHCLSPPSRLRAACFGKRLRDELWPDETPLMTAKSTAATTPNDAATSSIGNAATRAAAGTKEVATNAAALESAKDLSLFALAATHGFSRGVAVAVEHLEHIEQSEQISERAAATLKAAEKAAYSHDAIGGVGGNGRAEQKYDNDQGEEEEHDELELPNKLWVESISHEETAFLYRVCVINPLTAVAHTYIHTFLLCTILYDCSLAHYQFFQLNPQIYI